MKRPFDPKRDWEALHTQIAGLGDQSSRKSYYPELQKRLHELEEEIKRRESIETELHMKNRMLEDEIGQRQIAEANASSERDKVRSIFDAAPVGMMIVDESCRVIDANRAMEVICGKKIDSILGLVPGQVFECAYTTPDSKECGHSPECNTCLLREMVRGVTNSREARYGVEIQHIRRREEATEALWLKFSAEPIKVSGNNCVVIAIDDVTETRRTSEKLRLSQQKYQNIFNLMPDMVGVTRKSDGKLIEVNKGFEVWTGWSAHEAIGRTAIELGLWCDVDVRNKAVETFKEKERLENFEFLMRTKSGEIRNGLMYLTSINVEGEDCFYFVVQDITELKHAHSTLQSERGRLRILLQTIPALVWMKDPDGKYIAINSRFECFCGTSESGILGKTDFDLFDTDLANFFRENDQKAMLAGKPTVNEEWITYSDDGHSELLETIKTPVHDNEGKLIGVLGIGHDITKQRRVEEQLKTERQRFKNLVDSVDGIVWEMDVNTFIFTYVSQQAERLLGYPVDDWYKPKFWIEHLHPEDREWAVNFCEMRTSQNQDHDFEYRMIALDGHTVWFHDIVTVVEENGHPCWLRGIMVDTTGKKLEEEEKHKLEAQLRQAQKMEAIGRLAGGIAHDFNNKLSIIMGYAELAGRAGKLSDRYNDYLGQVINAANQSREITRQLLAFSRQEVISPRIIDLNDVVRDSQKGLCRFIGEDINFEVRLAEKLWPINIDPSQLDQIIMNLVVNARDAMTDGGHLIVETKNTCEDRPYMSSQSDLAPGDYVMLSVSDTGCGMDQEIIQHIFEPFYTTKEVGKGTGLGLATVYGIVSQNNGFVDVISEPGVGSIFKIFFPRSDDLAHVDEQQEPELELTRPASVLLVEDDDILCAMTAELLKNMGYTVSIAVTPQIAIDICADRQNHIDLLLTDVIMPHMNGKDLADRIAELRPEIKVLFLSGYTADIITQKGILPEGLYFIQKPFTRAILHQKIQAILDLNFQ